MVRSYLAAGVLAFCGQAQALTLSPLDLSAIGAAAQPNVAADAVRGGFVLSWQQKSSDGCAALFTATLGKSGELGPRHRVASGCDWFINWADFPSLMVAQNGDWVTFWLQKSADSTYAYDIRLVRSADQGRSWSKPLKPHRDGTSTEHGFVSMMALDDDRVLLAWLDGRFTQTDQSGHSGHDHASHGEGDMTLRSAVVTRDRRISEEIELDARVCSCCLTDLARSNGVETLVYRNRSVAEIRDIYQIERRNGRWGKPAGVHADRWHTAACPVNGPAIAKTHRHTLVVWPTQRDTQSLLKAQFGSAATKPLLLEQGELLQGRPDTAAFANGQFLVTWLGVDDAGQIALKLLQLGANATVVPPPTVVATLAPGRTSGMPKLASQADQAVLVWTELGTEDARPQIKGVLARPTQ